MRKNTVVQQFTKDKASVLGFHINILATHTTFLQIDLSTATHHSASSPNRPISISLNIQQPIQKVSDIQLLGEKCKKFRQQ